MSDPAQEQYNFEGFASDQSRLSQDVKALKNDHKALNSAYQETLSNSKYLNPHDNNVNQENNYRASDLNIKEPRRGFGGGRGAALLREREADAERQLLDAIDAAVVVGRGDVSGPVSYQGQHTEVVNPVCPPEWNLTPSEYTKLVAAVTPTSQTAKVVLLTALSVFGVAIGGVLWDIGVQGASVFPWCFTVCCLMLLLNVWAERPTRREQDTSRLRLRHRDPAEVLSYRDLPDPLWELVDAVVRAAEQTKSAKERRALLELSYNTTHAFHRAYQVDGEWSLQALVTRCPDEAAALAWRGSQSKSSSVREAATVVVAARQAYGSPPSVGQPVVSTPPSLHELCVSAVQTHDRVADAWGAIITDPLNALTHSALFDVGQPRTAAFLETYGHAQDLRAVHGSGFVNDKDTVREYRGAVRKAEAAWAEALRYSEHITFGWLPDEEASNARKAAAFLAIAADESASMHERATAAGKAADLLRKVTSFMLPPEAMHALEAQVRLELTTGPADQVDLKAAVSAALDGSQVRAEVVVEDPQAEVEEFEPPLLLTRRMRLG